MNKKSKKKITYFKDVHPNLNLIFTLLAIAFIWQGAWDLMDKFFLPNMPILSDIIPIAIGLWYLWFNDHSLNELDQNKCQ